MQTIFATFFRTAFDTGDGVVGHSHLVKEHLFALAWRLYRDKLCVPRFQGEQVV